MDDKFLRDARRDPRPDFAAALRERLHRQSDARPPSRPAWAGLRRNPALGALAAALAAVLLFTIPSVRVSAQAFLDLFRVRTFAAVTVDPARLEQFKNGSVDMKGLLGDRIQTLKDPGPPRLFTEPVAAGQAAGFMVKVPGLLPGGLRGDSVFVEGEGEAQLTVDTAKLREVLTSLGITDVVVPGELNGTKVTVHVSPAVRILYRSDRAKVCLLQARSPEVTLPAGLDLARLGEIGLRIAGLSPAEAHRFAQTIDWHSTVLVPVPANATSFREVNVRGNQALLISTTGDVGGSAGRFRRGSILLWSEGDMVYALTGSIDNVSLLQMANSLQ